MRKFVLGLALAVCWIALLPATVRPAAAAETLDAVLARMDQEAAAFHDLNGQLVKTTYTAVLNDTSKEAGEVWIQRAGRRDMRMRIEFTGANPRAIEFHASKAEIYYPKIRTVQVYDLGKSRSLIDQFLLLGFGTPGRELSKGYKMKVIGEDAAGGQACTRLQLTPVSQEVLKYVTQVELWIPLDAGHPVQQRFLQPGGDFVLIAYSGIRLNPNLPETSFRLDLPKDVKVEYPQK
jgi:outer membrane lipoprotein-sorting protein